MKKLVVGIVIASAVLSGCETDAGIASRNLSKAADMFEIQRRVVFLNGITDKYILSIEGLCSVDPSHHHLSVTCKTGAKSYKKHFLGTSDNVTWFAEQLEPAKVGVYHYRVIFKPQSIIPNVDLETSLTK